MQEQEENTQLQELLGRAMQDSNLSGSDTQETYNSVVDPSTTSRIDDEITEGYEELYSENTEEETSQDNESKKSRAGQASKGIYNFFNLRGDFHLWSSDWLRFSLFVIGGMFLGVYFLDSFAIKDRELGRLERTVKAQRTRTSLMSTKLIRYERIGSIEKDVEEYNLGLERTSRPPYELIIHSDKQD